MYKIGIVISDKLYKTRTILINYKIKINKIKNKVNLYKKILIHDEYNNSKYGDIILCKQSKPYSKNKHYIFIKRLK
jgi:small subunit ribosomal protein S17